MKKMGEEVFLIKMAADFCKGCYYDKNIKDCLNDHKGDFLIWENGRFKVKYCQWFVTEDEI